jgi:hypothetical protein
VCCLQPDYRYTQVPYQRAINIGARDRMTPMVLSSWLREAGFVSVRQVRLRESSITREDAALARVLIADTTDEEDELLDVR